MLHEIVLFVAVLLENFGNAAVALRHHRIVAGITRTKLHDDTGRITVVVAPSDQR